MAYLKVLFDRCWLAAIVGSCLSTPVAAQDLGLNYESLSSLEEPLATTIGDWTVQLTGLADVPLIFDLEIDLETDFGFVGNFQVSAETQLSNRWQIGIAYFGQYETVEGVSDDYSDNIAGFVGGAWGTLVAGNVSGLVREETRRRRGAGNGVLAFDDVMGTMEDVSGGYVGRFGPTILSIVVDEEENFDLGLSFQRPIGNKDYRFAVRYNNSEFAPTAGGSTYDTQAVTGLAEFIYGSSLFDLSLGYEKFDSNLLQDVDRWYLSTGARWKGGVLGLSAEAHVGEIDGESETSVALGAQFDVARGMSINFGLNYADSNVMISGIPLTNIDETNGIVSLRYSF